MKKSTFKTAIISAILFLLRCHVGYATTYHATLYVTNTSGTVLARYAGTPRKGHACPEDTIVLLGGYTTTGPLNAVSSYKLTWTDPVTGVKKKYTGNSTSLSINIICTVGAVPATTVYSFAMYSGAGQTGDSSIATDSMTVYPLPIANAGKSPQSICPASCTSCFLKTASLGKIGSAIPECKYSWSARPSCSSCGYIHLPAGAADDAYTPSPNVTTTYTLMARDTLTGCSASGSATVIVGASAGFYGGFPVSGAYGWYAGSYNCNPTTNPTAAANYDMVIWGNTTTYGTYSIKVNKLLGTINILSSKYASYNPTISGTLHSIIVNGGVTVTIAGDNTDSTANMIIKAADSFPTTITFEGINNNTGISIGNISFYTPPFYSQPKYPTTLISSGSNNSFGSMLLCDADPTIHIGRYCFLAAELQGIFNMKTNSLINIQWGNELKLNGATLQGNLWDGIFLRGRDPGSYEPPIDSVLTNHYPYMGHDSGGVWISPAIESGALYVTKGSKIINANSVVGTKYALPGQVAGILVGTNDPKDAWYRKNGAAIVIADSGSVFQNSSIYFSGPYNTEWKIKNPATQKYIDSGADANISYFHKCNFYNSSITMNNINFYIKQKPTFSNCNFTGTGANIYSSPILSYNSEFYASSNDLDSIGYVDNFISINDLAQSPYELITNNAINVGDSSAGIHASGSDNLFVLSKNFFRINNINAPYAVGINLYQCTGYQIEDNIVFNEFFTDVYGVKVYNSGAKATYTTPPSYFPVQFSYPGTNIIDMNLFLASQYGAFNYGDNSSLKYRCNVFGGDSFDIYNAPAHNMFPNKYGKGVLPDQGEYNANQILWYSNANIFSSCYTGVYNVFNGSGNKSFNYYDTSHYACTNLGSHYLTGKKHYCHIYWFDFTVPSGTAYTDVRDVRNLQEQINSFKDSIILGKDSAEYSSLVSERDILTRNAILAFKMDNSLPDSTAYDSSVSFLKSQFNYLSQSLLVKLYMKHGQFTSAQNVLAQLSDSFPTDTEITNFKKYFTLIIGERKNDSTEANIKADSANMEIIAHSSSSLAGAAQNWLQYYFEDIPKTQYVRFRKDSSLTYTSQSFTSGLEDSLVFKVDYKVLHSKVDSIAYIKVGGEIVDSSSLGSATYSTDSPGKLTIIHPNARFYIDTFSFPVTDTLKIPDIDTLSMNFVQLCIWHNIEDSIVYTGPSGFSDCIHYPVTDSLIASNLDSLTYFINDSTKGTVSYSTTHVLTDTSVNYSVHYTVGSITDSFKYYISFLPDFSSNPIFDTTLYYKMRYSKDSIHDSTKRHSTVRLVPYGGMGFATDSTVFRTTYYVTDSIGDTTLYFSNNFNMTFKAEVLSFSTDTLSPFSWVRLFPEIEPQFPDTPEGGGAGMVLPQTVATADSSLKISIAPNPFTTVLHVNFTNQEIEDHNGTLFVINSLGQQVQSKPVDFIGTATGEFDIDLSRLSKGFYYIVVQDSKSVLYNNSFIKQ